MAGEINKQKDLHKNQPVLHSETLMSEASVTAILLHGRGGSAEEMLEFAAEFQCDSCAFLAPRAAGSSWYPYSFLSPLEKNEPWLSSAIHAVKDLVKRIQESGIPSENIVMLGFSQGACLALEYAARYPRRYGAIIGLSGGLIGPPQQPLEHSGDLKQTPVFIGCSDVDPHIPVERVEETARVYERMNAAVDKQIYPGIGHTINMDEITAVRAMFARLVYQAGEHL